MACYLPKWNTYGLFHIFVKTIVKSTWTNRSAAQTVARIEKSVVNAAMLTWALRATLQVLNIKALQTDL